jgi:predicted site-specific integrase-resolvase
MIDNKQIDGITLSSKKKYLRWDEVLKIMDTYGMAISRATLYNWSNVGTIISVKINGKLWFTAESIKNIVESATK